LLLKQICQARPGRRRVVIFPPPIAIIHRLTGIEQDRAFEIRLFLVFLDVESVGLGPDFPVDVANIVARRVFAVRGELDCKAVIRTTVLPRDEAFDDEPRADVQALDSIKRFCVQIVCRGWHS
jgi:hypothetical protein